ncbi:ADP-ribosylglycohydrolase family protein [Zooshikella marina]|uniref:ADP-ribosylglycohydrolase family protein n=1 Tax=Zooshikella ganghwensis TaxID=202772 RepID=UPI001BB08AB2|nr:ADP-ribosylglycohydrolase family protein [Zooshikella ganghwensis]MBU2708760.1 ADP-ribosylglycohydrolase family protein [Zooshikella ganghwensis]
MISMDQYKGCFLGLAIGDAFGAPYEGGPLERLLWKAIGKTKDGKLRYTDDTQMAIDLAKSFLYNSTINQDHLAHTFAESYQWSRGYGPSTSQLLKLIKRGVHWKEINKKKFKTGSFGNGAAMRAPILAMCFPSNTHELLNSVIRSAEITHAHPLGIEGAKLIALATQIAFQKFSNEAILEYLFRQCDSKDYKSKITFCAEALKQSDIKLRKIISNLGNGIAAPQSCVTAIYFSLKFRNQEFDSMLDQVIKLGGDTDTISSMAGAIWGAFNGSLSIKNKAKAVERSNEIIKFAEKLFIKQEGQPGF